MKKIITIAVFAFACGRVPAANMCVQAGTASDNAVPDGNVWAVGAGCGGHDQPASLCTNIYAMGIAALRTANSCVVGQDYDDLPGSAAAYNGTTPLSILCKRTWPTASKWVCFNASTAPFGGPWGCAAHIAYVSGNISAKSKILVW